MENIEPSKRKIRRHKPINRKTKLNIVFDEKSRRTFLTGFHKRKVERKQRAQEVLERKLKEERKRIKREAKESYKKLVVSYRPIPELDDLLAEQSVDFDNHSVSVVELSTSALEHKSNWIGSNRVHYDDEDDDKSDDDKETANNEDDPLFGMDFKTEKELKKAVKKQATKKVKKSKIFQMQSKIHQSKQKKRSSKLKEQRFKSRLKHNKVKGQIKSKY